MPRPAAGGGAQGTILSRRGVAIVDPRSNLLFVQDTPSKLEEVRRMIRQIDVAVRQVLIEARIVVAGDSFSRQLGVRFGAQTAITFNRGRYALGQGGSARDAAGGAHRRRPADPRDAHADAVRSGVGHRAPSAIRIRRSST